VIEVSTLKAQLSSLRTKLMQPSSPVKDTDEAERATYEAVIRRLKEEILEEGAMRRSLHERLEAALDQSARFVRLLPPTAVPQRRSVLAGLSVSRRISESQRSI
jgi:hypothetical protein